MIMGQIGLRSFTVVAFLSVFIGAGKNFNLVKGYSFLHDYGKADAAAIPSRSVRTLDYSDLVQRQSKKVAICVFGICVDIPNIPTLNPKVPDQNQPNQTVSPEQPVYAEPEEPLASDNEKPITDLTGTWIQKASTFSADQRACTAGSTARFTVDGQDASQGVETTMTQRGNQVIIPPQKVVYSGLANGSYTSGYQSIISGRHFKSTGSGNLLSWRFTIEYTGTVSNDGNSITGETFCKTSAGSAMAKGTFTWTRKVTIHYTTLEPTPDKSSLNAGLTSPSPSYMKSIFGAPGQLSNNCSSITNANFRKLIVTESVGSFRVTGFKSTVATVRQILNKVKLEKPHLYEQLGTEGMLCVRKVRGGSNFSNHSWGTAIDIKINNQLDTRGNNKTQVGLKELYPYFHEEGFYWGAAFPTEDSMHFEASQQLIERWKASGEIP